MNRYYISSTGKGVTYKIDRLTGRTWLISGIAEHEVADNRNTTVDTEPSWNLESAKAVKYEEIIDMVSQSYAFGGKTPVGQSIKNHLEDRILSVNSIDGWSIYPISAHKYQVVFSYREGIKGQQWLFVVDTESRIVKWIEEEEKLVTGTGEVAVIKTNIGTIIFKFFETDAPNHVANFKKLARIGFYEGIYFHRVIPGFMIQAGDPLTKDDDRSNDGTGGPGYTIDAEFNSRKHLRGTLSMARKPDPNSAGSQFFICLKPQPGLDGQYTIFGQVIEGMDVVDKIAKVQRDKRDNPLQKVIMEKVTIETK